MNKEENDIIAAKNIKPSPEVQNDPQPDKDNVDTLQDPDDNDV